MSSQQPIERTAGLFVPALSRIQALAVLERQLRGDAHLVDAGDIAVDGRVPGAVIPGRRGVDDRELDVVVAERRVRRRLVASQR